MTDAPPGHELLDGKLYMRDAKGALIPAQLVKPADKLQDELVRALLASAADQAKRLTVFKAQAFADVDAFLELLAGEHKVTIGGKKGNITLQTVDGLMKVQVAVQDRFAFGPKLQVAKVIIDELAVGWGSSAPELFAMVSQAFRVDREGQVNRSAMFGLLRLDIDNERWREAMKALQDSMMTAGTARYIRFYRRDVSDGQWEGVSLDLATV